MLLLAEKQQYTEELRRLHKQTQDNLKHFRQAANDQRMQEEASHAQQVQQLEAIVKQSQQALMSMQQDKIKFQSQYRQNSIRKRVDTKYA